MRILGRLLGALLSASATSMLIVAACVVALTTSLLSPQTWRDALDNRTLINDLLPLALPAVLSATGDRTGFDDTGIVVDLVDLSTALSPEDWRVITDQIISEAWLEERLVQALDTFEAAIRGNDATLEQSINLASVREQLRAIDPEEFATAILSNARDCSSADLNRLEAAIGNELARIPICRVDRETEREAYALSITALEDTFSAIIETLPERDISVSEFYNITQNDVSVFGLFVSTTNQLLLLLYLCPAALLSLVVALAVRSRKGFGRWMGTVGLVVGLVLLLILLLWQLIAIGSLSNLSTSDVSADAFGERIATAVFRSLFSVSSSTLFLQAGIALGVGFALLAMSFLQREAPAETYLITEDGEIISTASLRKPDSQQAPLS